MKDKILKIGDLVMHKIDKRLGVVTSDCYPFGGEIIVGISVCKISWLDTFNVNLMDIKLLSKVS